MKNQFVGFLIIEAVFDLIWFVCLVLIQTFKVQRKSQFFFSQNQKEEKLRICVDNFRYLDIWVYLEVKMCYYNFKFDELSEEEE